MRLLMIGSVLLSILSACASRLSACASREALIARDNLTCTEIGFVAGTSEHRDCVLRLETARLQGHHHGH